jgi:polar amino acid transport system substrate-binding protein
MRQIYLPLGYKIDYVILPWARCVQEVRDGSADGLVATVYSQTPDLVFPEASLGLDETRFYTTQGSHWSFNNPADLGRIRLGVVQGYDYLEWLDLYIRRNTGTTKIWFARGEYPLEHQVTALQDGRIDAFVENPEVIKAYLKEHRGRVKLRTAGLAGPANRLYAAFSPNKAWSAELARLFDLKIDELRANGKLQAILERYGLSDWRPLPTSTGPGGKR